MTTDSLDVTPLVDSIPSADGANTDTGVVQQSESSYPSSQVAPTFTGQEGENSFDVMPHLGDMSQSSEMIQIAETSIIEKNDEDKEEPASDDQVLDADDAIENPDLDEAAAAEQVPQDQLDLGSQAESSVAEVLDGAQSQDTTIGGLSLSTLGWSALGAVGVGLAVSGGGSKPPLKPILTLANDNGIDGDGVTNSGVVLVGDLVDSATWEYSLDNGATWVSGQGNSFELDQDGSYSVVARQTKGDKESEVSATLVLELNTVAPVLEASDDISIVENSGANQAVFAASAADDGAVTYSLADGSDSAFDIDSTSGQVTLIDDPDFESKDNYTFTVVAADLAGNTDQQTIELSVTNLDEVAPSITSSDQETVVENSGADQVIYTATADDSADVSDGVVFSLSEGSDAALTIDSVSGAVTLAGNPDFESQQTYAFTVVATDGAGNVSEKPVTLLIEDVDEIPPAVTSIESSVDNQTVIINYNESLSQAEVPNVTSFTLRQGGVELDVSAVSIEDDSVMLAIGSQLTVLFRLYIAGFSR